MNLKGDAAFAERNVVFAADGSAPNTRISEDIVVLGTFSSAFYRRLGIPHEPVWHPFHRVVDTMFSVLNKNTSINSPSVFKRCAAFTIAFMEVSPLAKSFDGFVGKQLSDINSHQNAMVAFGYCRQCLNKSSFEHPPKTIIKLVNKIKVSPHFYCDLIHSISSLAAENNASNFHLLSLLYEALVYSVNPKASDERTV